MVILCYVCDQVKHFLLQLTEVPCCRSAWILSLDTLMTQGQPIPWSMPLILSVKQGSNRCPYFSLWYDKVLSCVHNLPISKGTLSPIMTINRQLVWKSFFFFLCNKIQWKVRNLLIKNYLFLISSCSSKYPGLLDIYSVSLSSSLSLVICL